MDGRSNQTFSGWDTFRRTKARLEHSIARWLINELRWFPMALFTVLPVVRSPAVP